MISNILTIDFEDFYSASKMTFSNMKLEIKTTEKEIDRICRHADKILKLLERNNTKATFFIVGYLGEKYSNLISSIALRGHDIGSHGYRHQLIDSMTKNEFENDLKRSIIILEGITNRYIKSFRAPAWSLNTKKCPWFWEVISKNGIEYDSSIFPTRNFLYGDPNAPRFINSREFDITEIPPSTINMFNMNIPFSGGFYLRIFPYWFIKLLVNYINGFGHPVTVYFHPYELDEGLERIVGQTFVNNFINHYNTRSTIHKIEKLLRDFKFCSIEKYFNRRFSPSFNGNIEDRSAC